jgi:LCP family protein required for cell wall assembly
MSFFKRLSQNFPKDWISRLVLAGLLVLSLVGAFLGYRMVRRLVAGTTAFTLPGDPVTSSDGDTPGEDSSTSAEDTPSGATLPNPDPWDGTSRVNLLVMGLDLREGETETDAPRSDTMILLSMDPLNNTVSILAIPRDMWVAIPGFGYYKINSAYHFGELYDLPGGGPELASRTVEEFLGVPIDYYAQVDFQAFVDFVDHINGIKVTFDEPYTIDRRGPGNTVTLEPGTYVLDGEYALAMARDRKSELDDFDRSNRQMEVIMLIRDRILEFDQLPTLVMNAPAIYEDLSTGIRMNMGLNQIIQLAWKAMDIPSENFTTAVIGPEYVTIEISPDGLDILRPIPDKIRQLRDELFGTGGILGPAAAGDLLSLVAAEQPAVRILNGSYQSGLEDTTAAWLQEQGFTVVEVGSAPATTVSSVLLQGATPYGLQWLVDTFGMTVGRIEHAYTPGAMADLVLTLGDDWAANNPMP